MLTMKILHDIIQNLLDKHPYGGEQYFNDLDLYIAKEQKILWYIIEYYLHFEDTLVFTGNFGHYFRDFCDKRGIRLHNIIHFNGSLRKDENPEIIYRNFFINSKSFIFIDDSVYSKKTLNSVERYIIRNFDQRFRKIFVVYDGSKEKDSRINSLYRYYDHH